MDVKSLIMIKFLFASILMEILWSLTKVNALTLPDCRSLSKDILKLRQNGETKIAKYVKKWDTFFATAHEDFESQVGEISKDCIPKPKRSDYYDDAFSTNYDDEKYKREVEIREYKEKVKTETGEMAIKSTLQKYMKSSKIEDQIRMAKYVEDECEKEVSGLWKVLISLEKEFMFQNCKKNLVKNSYNFFKFYNSFPFAVPSINGLAKIDYQGNISYQFKLDDEDNIIQYSVEEYQKLLDDVNELIPNVSHKEVVDKKFENLNKIQDVNSTQTTKHNRKVFLRGVQKLKRLENQCHKGFVPLKVEAMFNKKLRIYKLEDIKWILSVCIRQYVDHVNNNRASWEFYRERLMILAYQTLFV